MSSNKFLIQVSSEYDVHDTLGQETYTSSILCQESMDTGDDRFTPDKLESECMGVTPVGAETQQLELLYGQGSYLGDQTASGSGSQKTPTQCFTSTSRAGPITRPCSSLPLRCRTDVFSTS